MLREPAPSRSSAWRGDALGPLSLMVVLLFVFPPRLVLTGANQVGRPALLMAAGLGLWWLLARMTGWRVGRGPRPLHWALSLVLITWIASYAVAAGRGVRGIELNAAHRSLALTVLYMAVALVVADGLASRERLDRLLVTVLYGGCFMALVGALQFLADVDITPQLTLPGFSPYSHLIGQGSRGFPRVAGSAGHFIEFGVVLTMLLPIALHYALHRTPPPTVNEPRR